MKKILILVCLFGLVISAEKISDFSVKGMMCGVGCIKKINNTINGIDGVKNCDVNFEKERMQITYDDELVNDEMIINALSTNTTYSCKLNERPKDNPIKLFFKNLFN